MCSVCEPIWLLMLMLQVQSSVADVLLLSGVATSRYAGRLFRPSASPVPGSSFIDINALRSKASLVFAGKDSKQQQQPHAAAPIVRAAAGASTPTAATHSSSGSSSAVDEGKAADDDRGAAAAAAALSTADGVIQQLAAMDDVDLVVGAFDATVDVESGQLQDEAAAVLGGDPTPLVMQEQHTEQE